MFCPDLISLRKRIMIDYLGFLVSIATKEGFSFVAPDNVYDLDYFLLDFIFVIFLRYG